jgi:hypothetical protein
MIFTQAVSGHRALSPRLSQVNLRFGRHFPTQNHHHILEKTDPILDRQNIFASLLDY